MTVPGEAILEGAYDTVFDKQVFITDDGDASYGYNVLRAGRRTGGQPPGMGVARSL